MQVPERLMVTVLPSAARYMRWPRRTTVSRQALSNSMWFRRISAVGSTHCLAFVTIFGSGLRAAPCSADCHTGAKARARKAARPVKIQARSRIGVTLSASQRFAAQVGGPRLLALDHEGVTNELVHAGHADLRYPVLH